MLVATITAIFVCRKMFITLDGGKNGHPHHCLANSRTFQNQGNFPGFSMSWKFSNKNSSTFKEAWVGNLPMFQEISGNRTYYISEKFTTIPNFLSTCGTTFMISSHRAAKLLIVVYDTVSLRASSDKGVEVPYRGTVRVYFKLYSVEMCRVITP